MRDQRFIGRSAKSCSQRGISLMPSCTIVKLALSLFFPEVVVVGDHSVVQVVQSLILQSAEEQAHVANASP